MNIPANRSLAKSQKLEFNSGNNLAFLNFLSNINSKEATSDPNNIQTDFIRLNENIIVLGIKTPRTVAAVLLNSITVKAELKFQMNLEENWIEKYSITAFKFLPPTVSPDFLQLLLIIGANNGSIRIQKMSDEKPQYELNLYRDPQKKVREVWFKKKVLKLALHPNFSQHQNSIVIVLFEQGFMHQFNISNIQQYPPSSVLDSIQQQMDHVGFALEKQQTQPLHRKSNQTEHFSYNFYNDSEFTFMSVQLRQKTLNLQALYRFECATINELEILPFSPIDYSRKKFRLITNRINHDDYSLFSQFLIVALTGLDGYFRIVELQNMIAIFSFRSDFGGFNSFSFNEKYSMVVLAAQDDHIYVINFQKSVSWLKLQGHNSFIGNNLKNPLKKGRSIFLSVNSDFLRVVAGGYDGYLSFTELSTRTKFIFKDQNDLISLRIDGCENENQNVVLVQNKILMNKHGICYVQHYENFLITLNFDGCISIFFLQNYTDQLDEKVEIIQEEEPEDKTNKQEDKSEEKKVES